VDSGRHPAGAGASAGVNVRHSVDTPAADGHEPRPGRQRMIDTARGLFCVGGYGGTPLRAVSDALGVTKAALYYHFKAKEDLLAAIVSPLLGRIDELVGPAGRRLDSEAARRAFLGRYVDELSDAAEVTALLLRDPAVADHALGRRFAAQRARMTAMLGGDESLAAGIRTSTALRALELAVVDFGDADPAQVRATALRIAVAVLETAPPAGGPDPPVDVPDRPTAGGPDESRRDVCTMQAGAN
jgi:AcrR family transcriptional regulator